MTATWWRAPSPTSTGSQHQEFPPECRDADYEKRIKAAYPIHPEVFDRLYTDWSTLVKFQRTRGVLRLMAAVIHSLWEKGDKNPLILPANIPIDDPRVQFELTRYLSDNWAPVIEKDVDGPNSLPLRLDGEVPNLGKFSACRRVARTIYLGSAPTTTAAHRGLEDRRVKLGCVMPGESPAIFGDALRRLAGAATYLYQDGPRYWYSTQPTVTKLAEDRAEQLKRDPDKVVHELDRRLRADLRNTGDFSRIHPMPQSGQDVPDDLDARLVVLRVDHPYSKEPDCAAEAAAKAILRVARQHAPALSQHARLPRGRQDPTPGPRRGGAEVSRLGIDPGREGRSTLEPHAPAGEAGRDPARRRGRHRHGTHSRGLPVAARSRAEIAAGGSIELQAIRLASGHDALAVRVSKKLKNDELLLTGFAGTLLRMELDRVPLWRGNHVAVKQLAEDFARYPYLPRLKDSAVLVGAIRDGVALLTWQEESFAFADSFDETTGRYRGLRGGQLVPLADADSPGLLVKGDVARSQLDADRGKVPTGGGTGTHATGDGGTTTTIEATTEAGSFETRGHSPQAVPWHGHARSGPRGPRCQPRRR